VNDEAQFEAWLGQSLSGVPKGPCPDAALLSSFVAGELSGEQRKQMESHIAACGYCDLIVTRMRAFEQAIRRDRRTRWLWLVPAFSLGVVLALALRPGPVMQLPTPAASVVPPAIQSAEVIQLDTKRGVATRAKPVGTGPVALSFLIPIVPAHHYEGVIANSAKQDVWRGEVSSYDQLGNCFLICDRKTMPAGRYTLTVTEKESPSRRFDFSFDL
jgi:hypothetical protein